MSRLGPLQDLLVPYLYGSEQCCCWVLILIRTSTNGRAFLRQWAWEAGIVPCVHSVRGIEVAAVVS